jgi:activating signal cointegrator complex subunit 3
MILLFYQVHGTVGEPWWIWVEDPTNDHIYHSEYFLALKKQVNVYVWYIIIILLSSKETNYIYIININ